MKRGWFALCLGLLLPTIGFAYFGGPAAQTRSHDVSERWVSENHLQVHMDGQWVDVPLVPLSDTTCRPGNPFRPAGCP